MNTKKTIILCPTHILSYSSDITLRIENKDTLIVSKSDKML